MLASLAARRVLIPVLLCAPAATRAQSIRLASPRDGAQPHSAYIVIAGQAERSANIEALDGGVFAAAIQADHLGKTATPAAGLSVERIQERNCVAGRSGASTEQIYLEMYGTGIRSAASVTVTVGGQSVPVIFSGAAPGFAGEDQVNIGPLPRSLAGKGAVNIVLTADGHAANTVNVTIQ